MKTHFSAIESACSFRQSFPYPKFDRYRVWWLEFSHSLTFEPALQLAAQGFHRAAADQTAYRRPRLVMELLAMLLKVIGFFGHQRGQWLFPQAANWTLAFIADLRVCCATLLTFVNSIERGETRAFHVSGLRVVTQQQ